jgi:hypothetical protein
MPESDSSLPRDVCEEWSVRKLASRDKERRAQTRDEEFLHSAAVLKGAGDGR